MVGEGTQDGSSHRARTLKSERDRFVAFAFSTSDMLLELDSARRIVFAAGATSALTGRDPGELAGISVLDLVRGSDRPILRQVLDSMNQGKRVENLTIHLNPGGGSAARVILLGYRLREMAGRYFLAFRIPGAESAGLVRDLAQREGETALFTEASFAERAGHRLASAQAAGEAVSLTFVDIPGLPKLEKQLDVAAQTELKAYLGACLRSFSLDGDMAGTMAEDKFSLVHRANTDIGELRQQIATYSAEIDPGGKGREVETATLPMDAGELDENVAARVLVYAFSHFKGRGQKPFTLKTISDGLSGVLEETSARVRDLQIIMRERAFDMVYQPILDLRTRQIRRFEALVRLRNQGPQESPMAMVAFAEDVGKMEEFDLAIIRMVMDWMMSAEGRRTGAKISVNIAGTSINSQPFVTRLNAMLRGNRQLKGRLGFEITEYGRIHDLDAANRLIQELRVAGHAISLDDFGTGEMTYSILRAINVDAVKIDGKYVREALKSPRDRAFLKAIGVLCHELQVSSVAEMIEDEATAALVLDCGIEMGQGYLFGRPDRDIRRFLTAAAGPHPGSGPRPARAAALPNGRAG